MDFGLGRAEPKMLARAGGLANFLPWPQSAKFSGNPWIFLLMIVLIQELCNGFGRRRKEEETAFLSKQQQKVSPIVYLVCKGFVPGKWKKSYVEQRRRRLEQRGTDDNGNHDDVDDAFSICFSALLTPTQP